MENMRIDTIKAFLATTGVSILFLLIILFVGFKLTKVLTDLIERKLERNGIEVSLRSFVLSVSSWTLKICVVITAISSIGIQTTSFIALIGSAGLAVGLALQGSLANFAGGVLILLLKPFKVGDFVKAQSFSGSVDKITIFSTFLRTIDNQVVCIPNGVLANSPIVNVNQETTRRIDFKFGISYTTDILEAKELLEKVVAADVRILKNPNHQIVVGELADSSVNLYLRTWVNTADYWNVFFHITETVKNEFDANKMIIPYPQSDVHIHQ
jgi:small conductance mechanosensitive channel